MSTYLGCILLYSLVASGMLLARAEPAGPRYSSSEHQHIGQCLCALNNDTDVKCVRDAYVCNSIFTYTCAPYAYVSERIKLGTVNNFIDGYQLGFTHGTP